MGRLQGDSCRLVPGEWTASVGALLLGQTADEGRDDDQRALSPSAGIASFLILGIRRHDLMPLDRDRGQLAPSLTVDFRT